MQPFSSLTNLAHPWRVFLDDHFQVKFSMNSQGYERMAHINKYMYTPDAAMHGNTKFPVQVPSEGLRNTIF